MKVAVNWSNVWDAVGAASIVVAFGLVVVSTAIGACGASQKHAANVLECLMDDNQAFAADALGELIQTEVRAGRLEPTPYVQETLKDFAVEWGLSAVRCALRELISDWKTQAERSTENEYRDSIQFAETLDRSL